MKQPQMINWTMLSVLFLLSSCHYFDEPKQQEINCSDDPVFTVAYGATVQCENWTIVFNGDIEDSRCPATANCVWEGRVDVEFQFGNDLVRLGLPDDEQLGRSRDTIDNTIIELLEVSPFPVTTDPIPDNDYQIKLQVSDL